MKKKVKCNFYFIFCSFMVAISILACKGVKKAQKLGEAISYKQADVILSQQAKDSIVIHYLGCSGFLIQNDNQSILHDPFFSNISLFSVPFQPICHDTTRIKSFFRSHFSNERDNEGMIKLLLISHTHYDHMIDAPYIYQNHLNKDSVKVIGSNSMLRVMEFSQEEFKNSFNIDHIISVEDYLTDQNTIDSSFLSFNKKIRILPISIEHAPHFHGVHLFKGEIKKKPKKACQLKEGKNIAYLIEFLDDKEKTNFRIYIGGAAASAPAGFLPPSFVEANPIDLAILCAASHGYVKNYPEGLLKNLNPKHIIISHWENFFQPNEVLESHAMVVPLTNVRKFIDKVNDTASELEYSSSWTMPNINTKIVIRF